MANFLVPFLSCFVTETRGDINSFAELVESSGNIGSLEKHAVWQESVSALVVYETVILVSGNENDVPVN